MGFEVGEDVDKIMKTLLGLSLNLNLLLSRPSHPDSRNEDYLLLPVYRDLLPIFDEFKDWNTRWRLC